MSDQQSLQNIELTEREQEVLHELTQGKSNKQIALWLGISPKTVEEHLTSLYNKIGAKSRTEQYCGELNI